MIVLKQMNRFWYSTKEYYKRVLKGQAFREPDPILKAPERFLRTVPVLLFIRYLYRLTSMVSILNPLPVCSIVSV